MYKYISDNSLYIRNNEIVLGDIHKEFHIIYSFEYEKIKDTNKKRLVIKQLDIYHKNKMIYSKDNIVRC